MKKLLVGFLIFGFLSGSAIAVGVLTPKSAEPKIVGIKKLNAGDRWAYAVAKEDGSVRYVEYAQLEAQIRVIDQRREALLEDRDEIVALMERINKL